jgi:hypothetical protein
MTVSRELGTFGTVESGKLEVAIIKRSGKMSSGAPSFPTPDGPVFNHKDGFACLGKEIRRAETSNTCANHTDIRCGISGQGGKGRQGCWHPN